ncbi:MAG: DUF6435 family protein [Pseudomonadota bacterium]|nr:DUF6435 family protein [Pseudomonadota bacterium]
MFGLFKSNPTKKLRKQYDALLEKAMHAQRNGDIKTYSMLTAQSEELWKEIERLESPKSALVNKITTHRITSAGILH